MPEQRRYTGLPTKLREAVFQRDDYRCRWCGVTNSGYDIHHIQYRRGYSYDVIENLVCLCRACHSLVHDSYQIPKPDAQSILTAVISLDGAGQTGMALWRRAKKEQQPTSTGRVGRLMAID